MPGPRSQPGWVPEASAMIAFVIGSLFGGARLQTLLDIIYATCKDNDLKADVIVNRQLGQDLTPRGFSPIYNELINCAFANPSCSHVFVMNDDIRPTQASIIHTLMESDPSIGAAFPVEAWYENDKLITMMPFTGEKRSIYEALSQEPIEQVFAGFAFVCIRREAWKAVGQLDPSIGLAYGEDCDWGIRCWKAGFRIVNVRSSFFEHERGATTNRLVDIGAMSPQAPYEAAGRVGERYPFLYGREPIEQVMERLRGWYSAARTLKNPP